MPESEEDRSLRPDEYDIFEEPLEVPLLAIFHRRLANTDKSINKKSQWLKSEQNALNEG